jgi:hypothetical protein
MRLYLRLEELNFWRWYSSINVDPTKFNITPAVLGQIKDGINYAISYAGATAVAIDNIVHKYLCLFRQFRYFKTTNNCTN